MLSVYRDYGVILKDSRDDNFNRPSDDLSNYKVVRPGRLVINKMKTWQGSLGISEFEGIVSPAYITCDLRGENEPRYLHFLLRCYPYIIVYNQISYGVRVDQWDMHYEDFKQIPLFPPPLAEQRAIVAFLDRKLAEIDRYIADKEKLIALLQEQKTALINRAVTRGLNPGVKMKPSGVEWLGEIPAHWGIQRLRFLVKRIDQGDSPVCDNRLADEEHWGVLKAGCVNEGVFREEEHKRLPDGSTVNVQYQVQEGDVLMSRASGSPRLVGSVARVGPLKYRLLLSDKTFRLNFQQNEMVDFFVLVMNSSYFRTQVETVISGAEGLANNIPLSEIKSLALPVPPKQEAVETSTQVKHITSAIEGAINSLSQEKALMNEYRTALIAEAVTGKIDVREAEPLRH